MNYVEFEVNTGEENMQIDNDLLEFAIKNQIQEPTFRLYAWSPACVSLGRNQKDDFLDKDFLKSKNIDVVRRLTGGRALLHDKELTYSYICPVSSLGNGESVINSYKEISQILIDGFEKLGIKLEFGGKKPQVTFDANAQSSSLQHRISERLCDPEPSSGRRNRFDYCMSISTGADLCYEGKKLIGSAQFRKEGYILQHGSILFDYDKELIEKLFNEKADEKSLTCLRCLDSKLTIETLKNILVTVL